jgi:hypothetical protein
MPTQAEIEAARTPAGGWTREQLAAWGVPWPPPKGWRRRLAGLADRSMKARRSSRVSCGCWVMAGSRIVRGPDGRWRCIGCVLEAAGLREATGGER